MSTWLDTILKEHDELESPASFWYWSALSAISAVLMDKVWLNRQIYNLYPNIYVMLHAESGLKKGPPISMAKKLVKLVNSTRIITGRSSIQGILKELGTAKTEPGGKINMKSTAFICSSELSSSIVEDKVATTILTDLYDRQYNDGEWKSLLKMESFELKDPTITMLTATNEAHSEDFFARKDVQGGYFARTFIVYETKRHKINSLIDPLEHPPDIAKYAEYLKELSKLSGEFKPLTGTHAGDYYKDWYAQFIKVIDEAEIKDSTGTLNRFGDSVLKVAMLISLSESPELEISESAMRQAVISCEKFVGNVRRTTMTRGSQASYADQKAIIINELMRREGHSVSRLKLMQKYTFHFNATELNEIMQSLEQAGVIETTNEGNQIIYRMPEEQYKKFENYFKGKTK